MEAAIESARVVLDRGGPVMVLLLGLSVLSVAVILERTWFWIGTSRARRARALDDAVADYARGDREAARRLLSDRRDLFSRFVRTTERLGANEAAAVAAMEAVRPRLERFTGLLTTIIAAAPLLGILGTVFGIIRSFRLLGDEEALSDPTLVSGGIAEALLTTAAGLVVALVSLFPAMIFRAQVDRALGRLEVLASAVTAGAKQPTRPGSEEVGASMSPGS